MAIADLGERLALVDRGQKWVIRKLQALLEEVTHPQIRQELEAVLETHEINSDDYAAKAQELR
ncbi:dioxygenase [Pseudomonas sp. BAY1663]|nr:dioxygenase [Pseudomonas sp. BAY1663]